MRDQELTTGRATIGALPSRDLNLAEHVCLAAVADGARHGWAIGTMLSPDAEIGRIWTLSRPLTYRAVDELVERGLLTRRGTEAGRGRDRTVLQITAAGRRALAAWLETPVEHVRDVRTELLLKLTLRQRAGMGSAALLRAQRDRLAPAIDALTAGGSSDDLVARWRRESARAVRRFVDGALRVAESE